MSVIPSSWGGRDVHNGVIPSWDGRKECTTELFPSWGGRRCAQQWLFSSWDVRKVCTTVITLLPGCEKGVNNGDTSPSTFGRTGHKQHINPPQRGGVHNEDSSQPAEVLTPRNTQRCTYCSFSLILPSPGPCPS